jgi:ribosomal protein S18 acetylase RimI-like enzyme
MSEVTVRLASADDAAVVGALLHDFNTEFDTPLPAADQFTARFEVLLDRDDQLVLLAEDHGTPVGFAYLTLRQTPYHDGPLAQLEELYVRPDRRDQRIGSALMQRALDLVGERNAGEMHINVDGNDFDTRRFYEERFGFVNVSPETGYQMLFYEREL